MPTRLQQCDKLLRTAFRYFWSQTIAYDFDYEIRWVEIQFAIRYASSVKLPQNDGERVNIRFFVVGNVRF